MLIKKETNKNDAKTQKSPHNPETAQTTYQEQTNIFGQEKKGQKTRVTIKYDVGFKNQIYIRGKGANLSWEKGQPLKNVKADEWVWETDVPFSNCEFKVLINDRNYETGNNHFIAQGSSILYTPYFQ